MSTSGVMTGTTATAPAAATQTAAPLATTATGQAPATAAAPTAGVTTDTVNPGAWKAGFNDDLKGYIDNKGFKSPADVAEAYRNFEKLQGVPQDRILKLTDKMRDEAGALTPEARAIWERLGAPKESKGYELAIPKEGGDPKLAEHFKETFFKMGVPKEMAEGIVNEWNGFQAQAVEAQKQQAAQVFKDSDAKLRSEWGAAYEQNTNIAKEAVRNLGLDAKKIDALAMVLGHDGAMKLFADLGKATGEGKFHSSPGGNNGPLEPAQARAKLEALKQDKSWVSKYVSGDVEARAQMESLQKQINPGQIDLGGRR